MTTNVLGSSRTPRLATRNVGLNPKPIKNSSRAIGSENAHPGAGVWIPLTDPVRSERCCLFSVFGKSHGVLAVRALNKVLFASSLATEELREWGHDFNARDMMVNTPGESR
jgi:hypothetical protein